MTHGTTQTVKIETLTASGQVVEGAECRVANNKSDTVMLSGQSVPVRRSGANLSIECTQPGYAPANGQATSRVNTGMVGNILIGGLIGAAIDSGTGAGFNYPSWMQLVFGEVRTFDRSSQSGNQPMAGLKVGETRLAAAPPPPTPPVAAERPAAPPVAAAMEPTPTPPAAPRAPEPVTRVSMDDLKGLMPAKP
ncbi:MAG: hypothetical protein ABJA77_21900 [Variovorax sp.]